MESLSPRKGCTASGQRRLKPERPPRLYTEGVIDKAEFEPRIAGLKQRVSHHK
jgi:hypothetical protein